MALKCINKYPAHFGLFFLPEARPPVPPTLSCVVPCWHPSGQRKREKEREKERGERAKKKSQLLFGVSLMASGMNTIQHNCAFGTLPRTCSGCVRSYVETLGNVFTGGGVAPSSPSFPSPLAFLPLLYGNTTDLRCMRWWATSLSSSTSSCTRLLRTRAVSRSGENTERAQREHRERSDECQVPFYTSGVHFLPFTSRCCSTVRSISCIRCINNHRSCRPASSPVVVSCACACSCALACATHF